jgi:hypothetical protein
MSALTSALESITQAKQNELRLAKEAREQILAAIVREAVGETDDSDVQALRTAIEKNLFSTSELHELIAAAAALSEGTAAKLLIYAADVEANKCAEEYQSLLKRNRERETEVAQYARESRGYVAELQHKISNITKIKHSQPELYAAWEAVHVAELPAKEATEPAN